MRVPKILNSIGADDDDDVKGALTACMYVFVFVCETMGKSERMIGKSLADYIPKYINSE